MSKKILIVTGDAVEALEVFYPYYRCLEEGYDVTIASPAVKKLHTVVHDFIEGMETFVEKPAYDLKSHAAFTDISPEEFDGLVIPGGRAPEYIRMNEALKPIISHFFQENKPVGAICHAAQLLAVIPELMQGREYTAYPSCKPDVLVCGAKYIDEQIHTHQNLVSGQAWPDLPGFMREFLSLLK
ncbi:DJ-1/PfpI family protein [Halobacillus karajensis]|uniref:Cysteine protease YraA n=1 Tax=Halobacillus karajensis TaxID=195088 RepID=A0A024P9N9_9BACI|nr:DJ-1/PfpI family protein [Halobacillus karajensis]CDQ21355.1 Putative cysteine protease YraA [Halobacillus karajensis]CDQ25573.1 Putative cysteine protease YraA [Halobacillus karajensis]CDQ25844.1 Putative cysteine protease YraA [Halobacillus karajensis]